MRGPAQHPTCRRPLWSIHYEHKCLGAWVALCAQQGLDRMCPLSLRKWNPPWTLIQLLAPGIMCCLNMHDLLVGGGTM